MHFLLSIRPYRGVDFGHISVIEFLHGLFDLVLAGLDIHSEHKCVDSIVLKLFLSLVHSFEGVWVAAFNPGDREASISM